MAGRSAGRGRTTRRWAARLLAGLVPLLLAACNSGPGPADDKPYEQQIEAWRAAKDVMLRTDPESPIPADQRATFPGLAYFPIDPAFRAPAALAENRGGPPVIIELETSVGQHQRMQRVGILGFALAGITYHLTAFTDVTTDSMDRLFVPFGDLTNGSETYGGGRFLDLERTATNLYDLDFNRAYHPYCVYNHGWECPVPPTENRLAVAIRAGERLRDAKSGQ